MIKDSDTTGIGSAYYCMLLVKAKLPHNKVCSHIFEQLKGN